MPSTQFRHNTMAQSIVESTETPYCIQGTGQTFPFGAGSWWRRLLQSAVICGLICASSSPVLAQTDGLSPSAEPAIPPVQVRLSYDGHVGWWHAVSGDVQLSLTPGAYNLETIAETRGFIGFLFPWDGEIQSSGAFTGGEVKPQRHYNYGVFAGEGRVIDLTYQPDGSITESIRMHSDAPPREPVSDDLKRGTVDPLSAAVEQLVRLGADGQCGVPQEVYDGRARYTLALEDMGLHALPEDEDGIPGPAQARKCKVTFEMIAGRIKRDQDDGDGDPAWRRYGGGDAKRDRNVYVYLAPVEPGHPLHIPWRIERDGSWEVRVVLTQKELNGSAS